MQILFEKGNHFFHLDSKTTFITGAEIFGLGDKLTIAPIGNRGNTLNAGMEIPYTSLQNIINALQEQLNAYNLSGKAGDSLRLTTIMETAELRGCHDCGVIDIKLEEDGTENMDLSNSYVFDGEAFYGYAELTEATAKRIMQDPKFLEWAENNQLLTV